MHTRKERFLAQRGSKLLPRGDGPFQVLERMNDSDYKLNLPSECNVSATFNVSDLSPFDVDDDLRTNHSQEEGNNKGTTNKWNMDPIQVPIGTVTRVRAKRFKKTLNGLLPIDRILQNLSTAASNLNVAAPNYEVGFLLCVQDDFIFYFLVSRAFIL